MEMIGQLFQQLRAELASPCSSIRQFDGAPVLIYGAGNVGKDVFRLLTAHGERVLGFLDRNATPGAAWEGVPVWQPDHAVAVALQREKCTVVIGIFNRDVPIPPLVMRLRALGYERILTFLDLHDLFAAELGDRFWLTKRSFYVNAEPAALLGRALWADDASRRLYDAILRFRLTRDYACAPAPDGSVQYFATDVPAWTKPLRFVDCGAFDGDTLVQLVNARTPVEAIAAFEPDVVNFAKLATYVRSRRDTLPQSTVLFPCAVHSCTTQLRFATGCGEASHVSASGDVVIQCVSLDEALPCFRPNLIKMDIEGSEYAALLGARHTIAEHRPGLAICLYHRPEHLWQIPLLLQGWRLDYQFYLRVYAASSFDLVLYAIPATPSQKTPQ